MGTQRPCVSPTRGSRDCVQTFGITAALPPYAPVCVLGGGDGPGTFSLCRQQPQAETGQLGWLWGGPPLSGR